MMPVDTLPTTDPFAAWAPVYDTEPNPLLHLEGRYLRRLLPQIAGRDVIDVGCGTGRRLSQLAVLAPRSLHGVDPSPAMLRAARRKHIPGVELTLAGLPALPIPSGHADCVLASFVLAYVQDLKESVAELSRILRPGGDLLLSDMHPDTAARLGWHRGTTGAPAQATLWPLSAIKEALATFGFSAAMEIFPPFAEPEHAQFVARGKQTAWQEALKQPAIYLLHLRKTRARPVPAISFTADSCMLGAHEAVPATLTVIEGCVGSITRDQPQSEVAIDLSGYMLMPGLINAHDHLEFALFPRLGRGPYPDATAWAHDIQANDRKVIGTRQRIPVSVRLWWGALRNLLCGATTVCHHNPLHPTLLDPELPIHVLGRYGWAHSLAFTPSITDTLHKTEDGVAFFVHACEGISPDARKEVFALDALHALHAHTVLIHGLALDAKGVDLLNRRGAALAVCPLSNLFLFGRNHSTSTLSSVERLLLGSDSPLTSDGDLLDEVRFAATLRLEPERVLGIVTDEAASTLRLKQGEGTLRPSASADLIAVRARSGDPAALLVELSWRDVELVVLQGEVVLASADLFARLPSSIQHKLSPLRIEGEIRWLRAPVSMLLGEAEAVLGTGNVRLNGRSVTRVELDDAR